MRKVRIRSWHDMADEFGIIHGDIDCQYGFSEDMEDVMPDDRIIEIDGESWTDSNGEHWNINDEMIEEEVKEPKEESNKKSNKKWIIAGVVFTIGLIAFKARS